MTVDVIFGTWVSTFPGDSDIKKSSKYIISNHLFVFIIIIFVIFSQFD